MINKHPLQDMLEPVVEGLGYELVRVLTIGMKNPTLQVMIDRKDGTEITVDDCAKVSRAVSAALDEVDPIENRYTLEVSSPGLDRPLTKAEHFRRFTGYVVKLETVEPVEKRKRFKGIVKAVSSDNVITLEMDGADFDIAFDNVAKAKIVLTDELWEQYLKSRKSSEA